MLGKSDYKQFAFGINAQGYIMTEVQKIETKSLKDGKAQATQMLLSIHAIG